MTLTTPPTNQDAERLSRLRRLAQWLDDGIRIPGLGIRIGLDPVLGLLPGLGDAAGAILGGAIVVEAVRRRVPRSALFRMVGNVILDMTAGAIPLLGDAFDFIWKSNRRNLQLLERHSIDPSTAQRADRLVVGGLVVVLMTLCIGLLIGLSLALRALANLLL